MNCICAYSVWVNKMAARLSGGQQENLKESVEPVSERGAPSPSSESSPSGLEREKDGALGVPGGQPDVSPSGPISNNELPEPKVTILFELGTRHN